MKRLAWCTVAHGIPTHTRTEEQRERVHNNGLGSLMNILQEWGRGAHASKIDPIIDIFADDRIRAERIIQNICEGRFAGNVDVWEL